VLLELDVAPVPHDLVASLNGLSLGAVYGITVLNWQAAYGTELLFDRAASGAITV
jgi:hypothetical protein